MNINTQITKWQATFILVEQSNEPLYQKQEKIRAVVKEVTDNFEQIINSPEVSQANITLLFTNIAAYANRYGVDTRELKLKLLIAGMSNLFQ